MAYDERRKYQRVFNKDELVLLRQTIEDEIEFCKKQIVIVDDVEANRRRL
ncbi:MAG: hypothetical protein WCF23_22215 [Candidatus Nitrosopolaris sp.]